MEARVKIGDGRHRERKAECRKRKGEKAIRAKEMLIHLKKR